MKALKNVNAILEGAGDFKLAYVMTEKAHCCFSAKKPNLINVGQSSTTGSGFPPALELKSIESSQERVRVIAFSPE